jgi:hypothetical protein
VIFSCLIFLLGASYKKRVTIASSEMVTHRDLLRTIEDAVKAGNPQLLDQWLKQISDWERDPSGDNCPYVPQHKCEYFPMPWRF